MNWAEFIEAVVKILRILTGACGFLGQYVDPVRSTNLLLSKLVGN